MSIWSLLKDILLTGTGIALILSQMFAHTPQDALLVTGLALTVPTIAEHTKAVLSGPSASAKEPPGHGGSSPSSPLPQPGSMSD